jgi:hypothetical protein
MYNPPENRVIQSKPTAAYVLSLIGGIVGTIISAGLLGYGTWLYTIYERYIDSYKYYYYYYYSGFFALYIGIGVWCLASSIVVLVAARKLYAYPSEHTKWGTIILLFSIVGLGTVLGLIGGILALIYKPENYTVPQPSTIWGQPMGLRVVKRICPKCGRVIDENARFCQYCGNKRE